MRIYNAKQSTIYKSINKQNTVFVLHTFQGKVWKSKTNETAVRKSSEILLLKWKMAPEQFRGTKEIERTHHTSWFPVFVLFCFVFYLVNSAFLYQTCTESGQITKRYVMSTRATTTSATRTIPTSNLISTDASRGGEFTQEPLMSTTSTKLGGGKRVEMRP